MKFLGFQVACILLSLHSFISKAQQSETANNLELKLSTTEGQNKVDILNQLTYEFIAVNNEKVIHYNDEALKLSREIGYVKGEGVAFAYQGVFEYLSGKFPEAHKSFHAGLKLSNSVEDKNNIGYIYLQLGNCALEEVDTDSAFLYFTKSHQIFKDSSNPESLSKVYRNLSALYGQRFQQDSQQLYLDRAIAIRRLHHDKSLLADALAVQSFNKLETGDLIHAESLLAEAEEIAKNNPNDLENVNDIKHIRALILFQKGKFEEGIVLFDSARNYYLRTDLLRKYVTLLLDIGKIFSDRGEYEPALNNLYEALRQSRIHGFETEMTSVRIRIGWVNFFLGDMNQALRMVNEALHSNPKKVLKADLANALMLKGVVLTDLNHFTEARKCLDSVFLIYKRVDNTQKISETFMNLGALETKLKSYPEGLRLYGESVKLAEQINYTYGLAWSNWGLGDIYFKLGDYKKAAQLLDQSEKNSRQIKANEILILNYNSRRDLLAAQGLFKESLKYAMIANELKDSIHRTDLARRFVNLEKIQEIEQRDQDIKELQKDKLLAEQKIHLQESKLQQQFILLVAGVVGITLLAALLFVYNRFYSRIKLLNISITDKNTRIEAQAAKLREVNMELSRLYEEVSDQKEEIQAQASELTESNRSISDINRSLEQLVAEKTVELRNSNDELVKYNNELLQFSYTVSHNLRGPVARLLGLSTIARDETNQSEIVKWMELIHKTSGELDLIIKDLSKILDLRNEPHRYRENVNLNFEWKQSLSLLQDSLVGNEEITGDFRALSEFTTVRAMMQSIFYNLLSNAIKFRYPNRILKVKAVSHMLDGNLVIEISDNGLGFNTELHKDKLFKLYRRFHSHVEGRGLGLYLIKSQVELLHGKIEVTSKPNEGSLFRVILPLEQDEVRHQTEAT